MDYKKCCVVNCKNTDRNSTYKFYKFPVGTWRLEQRNKWIAAIMRKNDDGSPWYPKPDSMICSAHFVGGKKSDSEASPSYVPSIFPPKLSQASKLIHFVKQISSYQRCSSKDQYREVENENKHNMIVDKECQAGTFNQLKLKLTEIICHREEPETFLTTEVEVEPNDGEQDNSSTEDNLQECEVKIEQPDLANDEQTDPLSFEVKTESQDDEVKTTQVQTDQISEVVKAESLDDEEETTQVQSDPITSEVKTEPRDDEEETTKVQPDPITYEVDTEPRDDEQETTQVQPGPITSEVTDPITSEVETIPRDDEEETAVPENGLSVSRTKAKKQLKHRQINALPTNRWIIGRKRGTQSVLMVPPKAPPRKRQVRIRCINCGVNAFRMRRHSLLTETEEVQQRIRQQNPALTNLRTSDRICHRCWVRRRRTLGEHYSDPSTSVVPASEQHIVVPDTLSGQIGPVEGENPEKEPTIVLNDYGRAPYTQSHCFYPGCHRLERFSVPLSLRKRLFTDFKFYVPENCRICNYHLKNDLWHKLNEFELSHTFTEAHICDFVSLLKQES